jgi:hypothetical protein
VRALGLAAKATSSAPGTDARQRRCSGPRAWDLVAQIVLHSAQRGMRIRYLGLFWQELADEDEMADAAVWTETLSGDGGLIAGAATLGAGEGLCRDALGTLHVGEQVLGCQSPK